MDMPLFYFRAFVKAAGSRANAAEQIGVSVGMVSHILCGRRGISPGVAMAVEAATEGRVSKAKLRPDLWKDGE